MYIVQKVSKFKMNYDKISIMRDRILEGQGDRLKWEGS